MTLYVLLLLVGFQLKHFVADYLLQANWMVAQKGDFSKLGGYAHAGTHVVGTVIVLIIAQVAIPVIVLLAAGEFAVHYMIDYTKIAYSHGISSKDDPHRFWAMHGFDQLLHHLTYAGMTFLVMLSKGILA